MYWFALAVASLCGFVCACGVRMSTNSKWKIALSFVGFTAITFISLIS